MTLQCHRQVSVVLPVQLNNDTEQLDNDTEPGTLEIPATDNNQQGCAGNVKNKDKTVKTKRQQPPVEVYTCTIIPLLKPCCWLLSLYRKGARKMKVISKDVQGMWRIKLKLWKLRSPSLLQRYILTPALHFWSHVVDYFPFTEKVQENDDDVFVIELSSPPPRQVHVTCTFTCTVCVYTRFTPWGCMHYTLRKFRSRGQPGVVLLIKEP